MDRRARSRIHIGEQGGASQLAGEVARSTRSPTLPYLARAPQGRQDTLWHVILMLGPRPIADMWRAARIDAAAELLLAASTDLDPAAAAQLRIQQATDGIRLDLLDDALTEYQKRLQALAAARKGGGT